MVPVPGNERKPHDMGTWREVWSRVSSSLPGLRRLRLDLSDRLKTCVQGQDCYRTSKRDIIRLLVQGSNMEESVFGTDDEDSKKLWLEWLEPVGGALREKVMVEGAIWCKLDEPESVHGVIKGGGEGGRRVLILQNGQEVEW